MATAPKTKTITAAPKTDALPAKVILSAFADEGANSRQAVEQLAVLAALGWEYYSPRWVNVSGETKHVMTLNKEELNTLKKLHADYGMKVASIGSPIGKVKLENVDDGSHNKFVPFAQYLRNDVATAIDRAITLETKLIRGFSFYPPLGKDPVPYIPQAVDQLSQIVEKCEKAGVVFGLEVEPNLVGQSGKLLAELAKQVGSPNLVCVFDGGNICCQNRNAIEVLAEFRAMVKYLGWIHIKDYAIDPELKWTGAVDEERLKNFVPANVGDSGHEMILRELKQNLPAIERRVKKLGVPGVFVELEPHLKGGGQFGGFSGPDGLGVAARALCSVLDYVGLDYDLRTFDHIRRARGF